MAYGRRSQKQRTKSLRKIRWYQRLGSYGRKVLGAVGGAAAGAASGYYQHGLIGALPGAKAGVEAGWKHYKAIPWKKKSWKYHRFGSNPTPKYGSNRGTRLGSNPGSAYRKGKLYGSNPGHRLGSNPGPNAVGKRSAQYVGRHHRTHKKSKISFFKK